MADKEFNQSAGLWEAVGYEVGRIVDYVPIVVAAHFAQGLLLGGGALAVLALAKKFGKGVDTERVVESDTFYHPSGELNPDTERHNEIYNQVIGTRTTFHLTEVFEEATISPNRLIRILKRAAAATSEDDPIVWSHLHKAMQREAKFFQWMPESIARRFGHYSENERKKIVNEMARCYRNFRSEVLEARGPRIPEIEATSRERYEYKRDRAMLIFQEGAGADEFTLVNLPEPFEDMHIPEKEDTRFIYDDYGAPVEDLGSHLHERATAMRAIKRRLQEDAALENPLLAKFFTRYRTERPIPVDTPKALPA